MDTSPVFATRWHWRPLLLCHLAALLLVLSYCWQTGFELWRGFSGTIFIALNTPLQADDFMTTFWAWMSTRYGDLAGGILMLILLILPGNRRDENLQHAFCGCLSLMILMLPLRLIMNAIPELAGLDDHSPSIVLDGAQRLEQLRPGIPLKDHSNDSFPADHATVLFLWLGFMLIRRRGALLSAVSIAVGILFLLPRLIAGAHWMSDVIVGGGAILFVLFSWFYATPVGNWINRLMIRAWTPVFNLFAKLPLINRFALFRVH